MAFTSYIHIGGVNEEQFFSAVDNHSRYLYSKIKRKTVFYSAKKKKSVSARSLLPQISALWNSLTYPQQILWTFAGSQCGLNGFRAFVSETSIRLKLGLSVPNTPSNYHNGWYGHIKIQSPAIQIQLAQYHPNSYYINKKVPGVKGLYAPVLITEPMALPLKIGISYRCDLTPVGASQYAKFYAVVRSSYQGVDRENICEINMTIDGTWHQDFSTIYTTLGHVIGYTLYFHIYGYRGDVYFDNLICQHSGVNWARDKNCSDIRATFSNQYYQIPNHWVATVLPDGAEYDSDYIDGI